MIKEKIKTIFLWILSGLTSIFGIIFFILGFKKDDEKTINENNKVVNKVIDKQEERKKAKKKIQDNADSIEIDMSKLKDKVFGK